MGIKWSDKKILINLLNLNYRVEQFKKTDFVKVRRNPGTIKEVILENARLKKDLAEIKIEMEVLLKIARANNHAFR